MRLCWSTRLSTNQVSYLNEYKLLVVLPEIHVFILTIQEENLTSTHMYQSRNLELEKYIQIFQIRTCTFKLISYTYQISVLQS